MQTLPKDTESVKTTGVATKAQTITSTAQKILDFNEDRLAYVIKVIGSSAVYIGGSDVTTSSGLPLDTNDYFAQTGEGLFINALYGIAAGNVEIRVLEYLRTT